MKAIEIMLIEQANCSRNHPAVSASSQTCSSICWSYLRVAVITEAAAAARLRRWTVAASSTESLRHPPGRKRAAPQLARHGWRRAPFAECPCRVERGSSGAPGCNPSCCVCAPYWRVAVRDTCTLADCPTPDAIAAGVGVAVMGCAMTPRCK